jgi:hypothetical protein
MKKTGKVLMALLLVIGLLTLTFGSVFAGMVAPVQTSLVDPVAKESFAGEKYTATVVAPPDMPGTKGEGGLIMPVGMGANQGQFSGSGLKISGLKAGETVSISFDFKFYNYMWKGSIYKWDGTRWVKLATKTVLPKGDETITWATATGVGNGTYALIIGNYGVPTSAPELLD